MTYNQVLKDIQTKLESHPFIKTVKFSSPIEWINRDEQPVFPLACFEINSGSYNKGRESVFVLTLWFLDKSGQEAEFETDVISDQHSNALDIVNLLRREDSNYVIDSSVSWSAISEKFEDYLSGVTLTINLSSISEFDACNFPT
jgi:hypothetical protein